MQIELLLENYIKSLPDSTTKSAMLYSLTAGGKRIRPQLLYTVLKGYSVDPEIGNPFACALEMIHTYSLIHDDLPAMDNDDLRRGLPTCHKQFNEATAILAGDGLLTYAFEIAAGSNEASDTVLKCISILSKMAGPSGMVYGQQLDLEAEYKEIDWDMLQRIHEHKTGCLLTAPLLIACTLAKHEEDIPAWKKIGFSLGLAFQIQDDILDIEGDFSETGKESNDEKNEKTTYPSLFGLEKSKKILEDYITQAKEIIIENFDSNRILMDLTDYFGKRGG